MVIMQALRMQFTIMKIIWYTPTNQVVYHVIANYILMASDMGIASNGTSNYVNTAQNNEQYQQGAGLDPNSDFNPNCWGSCNGGPDP